MNEKWAHIPAYGKDYSVSTAGRVWSNKRSRLMALRPRYDGYLDVTLCRNGKHKQELVHRLVVAAFLLNPDAQTFTQVNHKDRRRDNNNLDNLEWCTPLYNTHYAGASLSCAKSILQLDLNDNLIKKHLSIRGAGKATGVNFANICSCARGTAKTAGGFRWQYARG